jgi:CarD family transcriptional regulator
VVAVAIRKAARPAEDASSPVAVASKVATPPKKAPLMSDANTRDRDDVPVATNEGPAASPDRHAAQAAPVAEHEPPPRSGASPEVERRPMTHGGPVPIVRMPAKAEVFVEGDHVVYPTHGVGKVERIATEEIAGHKLELIHITFEENRMTLRVPVAKARSAGLR